MWIFFNHTKKWIVKLYFNLYFKRYEIRKHFKYDVFVVIKSSEEKSSLLSFEEIHSIHFGLNKLRRRKKNNQSEVSMCVGTRFVLLICKQRNWKDNVKLWNVNKAWEKYFKLKDIRIKDLSTIYHELNNFELKYLGKPL